MAINITLCDTQNVVENYFVKVCDARKPFSDNRIPATIAFMWGSAHGYGREVLKVILGPARHDDRQIYIKVLPLDLQPLTAL